MFTFSRGLLLLACLAAVPCSHANTESTMPTSETPILPQGGIILFTSYSHLDATPKNISIRKSSFQHEHLIFRRLLIGFG